MNSVSHHVWYKQMDCEVPISGLPNLRHVDMLRMRKVQALRIYQAQVFMSIFFLSKEPPVQATGKLIQEITKALVVNTIRPYI